MALQREKVRLKSPTSLLEKRELETRPLKGSRRLDLQQLTDWKLSAVCKSCHSGTWLGGGLSLKQCSEKSGAAQHFFFMPESGFCAKVDGDCEIISDMYECKGCSGEYGSCNVDVPYVFSRGAATEASVPRKAHLLGDNKNTMSFVSKRFNESQFPDPKQPAGEPWRQCDEGSLANHLVTIPQAMQMPTVSEWKKAFRGAPIIAEGDGHGCYIQKGGSHIWPGRILTVVAADSPLICKEGPMQTQTGAMAFPVTGKMAQRAKTRNLFIQNPSAKECTEADPCPVVFYLHGHDEHILELVKTGTDSSKEEAWTKVTKCGLMRYAHQEDCGGSLRSVLVFPQIMVNESWTTEGPEILHNFIVPIIQQHVQGPKEGWWDMDNIAIVGYSEGAFAALHAVTLYPHIFSFVLAAAPNRPDAAGGATWKLAATPQVAKDNWKLRSVVSTFGSDDKIGNTPEGLERVMTELLRTEVTKRANLYIRIYLGKGHVHWDELFNQWSTLHNYLWLGRQTYLTAPKPTYAKMANFREEKLKEPLSNSSAAEVLMGAGAFN
eukprot:CAMPEP_0170600630 /NCGR_PEP_ID=MMETSP0224-20130122/17434_1 /TAXON_ID=285029 /ORGANISM="Togula jolla, Strain CCCM 725" /LENGTH=547 /DNA_ID=CAMNT_0010925363 /DNA_START=131 /DNA_END=1774 /DNA_ORIENTATION=+